MTAWLEHHIAREATARGIDCEKVRKEVAAESEEG
jgi:hypothetical protein